MSQHHEQGSFLTGFTVGLLAGAAGYFMFGTDKGKKLRSQLVKEWDNARSEVGDQALPNSSFKELLQSVVKSFQEQIELQEQAAEKHRSKKITKPSPKDSKPKFKGTK